MKKKKKPKGKCSMCLHKKTLVMTFLRPDWNEVHSRFNKTPKKERYCERCAGFHTKSRAKPEIERSSAGISGVYFEDELLFPTQNSTQPRSVREAIKQPNLEGSNRRNPLKRWVRKLSGYFI